MRGKVTFKTRKVRAGFPERGGIPERSPPYTVLLPDRKTYAHCYWCCRKDHHSALCHSPVAVSRKCCLGEKALGKPASQACSMEKLFPSVLLQLSAECLHVKLSQIG